MVSNHQQLIKQMAFKDKNRNLATNKGESISIMGYRKTKIIGFITALQFVKTVHAPKFLDSKTFCIKIKLPGFPKLKFECIL